MKKPTGGDSTNAAGDGKKAADIRRDAMGQFARPRRKSSNSGVSSAAPRVLTGEEDATFDNRPGGKPLGTLKGGA